MGVRDALRMVDSFNKWAARNPERAKSLDDFIHDGLIAAAKRCESCLREKLGLSFVNEDQEDEIPDSFESSEPEISPPPGYESSMTDEADELIDPVPDTSYEIAVESTDYDSSQEIPIESDESSISIDAVERSGDETMEEIIIEGPQRDFSTDFVLVEPPPLVVDSDELKLEESVKEESLGEPELGELEIPEEVPPEPETVEKRAAFTWSEYEAAVTPASEPEPLESEYDEYTSAEDDYFEEPLSEDASTSDEESIDEPPEPAEAPDVWSSYDEHSVDEEEILEDEDDDSAAMMDDIKDTESGDKSTPITKPPAPPPPESEEDEEERKRRARRLFFGA